MLSRTGSTTNSNLHRTKSTTSVRDRRKHPLQAEPIDRQIARTDALIAAHRAFDRSRTSTSTDLTRSESALSHKTVTTQHDSGVRFSPASHLRRQRSTLQSRVPKLADTLRVPGSARAESRVNTVFHGNVEFGLQSESYGAEPSSYRRLRHSRSLLTPVRQIRQPYVQPPVSSLNQAPTLRTSGSPGTLGSPTFKLRLKRSLHFFHAPRREVGRVITAPAQLQSQTRYHPAAPVLALTQHPQTLETPQPKKRSSRLFSVRSRQHLKLDLQDTKNIEASHDGGTVSTSEQHQRFSPDKSRPISASISGKFKRLFGRSQRPSGVPPQQLAATKAHFNVDLSAPNPEAGFDSYLEPSSKSSRRNSLYIPSSQHPETYDKILQLPEILQRADSCESLSSKSKSRVTSWTNSIDTGSVATQPTSHEPKRLSVIKEDGGPHQPSSSAGRHIGGVTVFQQPLNVPQGYTIDSQRVYSALLKRIDSEQQEIKRTEEALKDIHNAQDQNDTVGNYLFSTPTIRRVESQGLVLCGQNNASNGMSFVHDLISTQELCNAAVDTEQQALKAPREADQSRLWGYSNEQGLAGRSPLRRITEEVGFRSDQPTVDSLAAEASSSLYQTNDMDTHMAYHRFAQSTDSVYSRTTDGGTNINYTSPAVSMEDMSTIPSKTVGIATILQSSCANTPATQLFESSSIQKRYDPINDKGAWSGKTKQQMQSLHKTASYPRQANHFREHAEIDHDDAELNISQNTMPVRQAIPLVRTAKTANDQKFPEVIAGSLRPSYRHLRASSNSSTVSLRLKEVPRNSTPAPSTTVGTKRSQNALSQKDITKSHTKDWQGSSDTPKWLPAHGTNVLKARQSQPVFSTSFDSGKENSPSNVGHVSPVSTPRRYSIRSANGDRKNQLRKGKSAMTLRQDSKINGMRVQDSGLPDSQSSGSNIVLAARLSKPFDMSIPDQNRPFDSTYLGQREVGGGSRLSVAPNNSLSQRPKTYGDLGKLPYAASVESINEKNNSPNATALPNCSATVTAPRTASGVSLGVVGKRLVSNFLKNRRKQKGTEVELSPEVDPAAFI